MAYDQDSLATYANPGLVRRALKDLDAGKVQILQQSALQIVIESDGQQVVLSASGLSQAGCSCPAAGACKHIVAAVLSIQKHLPDAAAQADADTAGSEAPPDNSAAQSSSSLLDEVLQLDLEQIAKQIGKAQREKALKLAQAYAHEANPQAEIAGGRLKIALEIFPEGIIYIAGAGFQGMLSEIEKDQAAWHLAALLALHQAQSVQIYGVAASAILGEYLHYKLLRLGKPAQLFSDMHRAAMNATTLSKDTLVVAISSSGSTRDLLHVVKLARKRGVKVLALSNTPRSPLASLSDMQLVAAKPEGPLSAGALNAKVGVMLLVELLTTSMIALDGHYGDVSQQTASATLPLLL